ncbi:M14 family metallopeptidase [Fodinibius saliphilus]|uniref:M14 family metallopeptidase n=1 Tax=Fodinibius saliphilus TaxID=1920650 RepID=UPI00110926AD|nr:M14 family metallopeptidase [Fodinibius saliphilus]
MTIRHPVILLAYSLVILSLLLVVNCSSSEEFSGFSYDPEGVTITTDKEIQPQHKRRIGVNKGSIWISNEFAGARMNDFYQVNDTLYRVLIEPENHPVNNSPWYAFKIWSDSSKTVDLQLTYKHGKHRYIPKLSHDGRNWQRIDSAKVRTDTTAGTATLTLHIDTEPLWVAAQEILTGKKYNQWADSLASKPWVTIDTVGYSHQHRPIYKMLIGQADSSQPQGVVIITGRQHPPEVTGGIASQIFINELASEKPLASQFRKEFEVWAYPLANPDGVQQGHWRHNAGGVDLNRDWINFNQPETQEIRDDLLPLKRDSLRKVYYGIDFHSTDENIFYPINREIDTFPQDFTFQWIDSLKKAFPDYPVDVEAFDTSSPITKNWVYRTFGADGVTYELNDEANRDSLRTVTQQSAHIIMRQLLEEKKKRK